MVLCERIFGFQIEFSYAVPALLRVLAWTGAGPLRLCAVCTQIHKQTLARRRHFLYNIKVCLKENSVPDADATKDYGIAGRRSGPEPMTRGLSNQT